MTAQEIPKELFKVPEENRVESFVEKLERLKKERAKVDAAAREAAATTTQSNAQQPPSVDPVPEGLQLNEIATTELSAFQKKLLNATLQESKEVREETGTLDQSELSETSIEIFSTSSSRDELSSESVVQPTGSAPARGQFSGAIDLNEQQSLGVKLACDFSVYEFAIYGSAGTGKTTLLSSAFAAVRDLVPLYGEPHNYLPSNMPAIAIVSYTRRAVRNLKRSLARVGASSNCITIHKLLEYKPEFYTEITETGEQVEKMRFAPSRHAHNKLSGLELIIVDEAGMCSKELHEELVAAAPPNCRFIYLGDLFQLPPIYGMSILGYKLVDAAEGRIPFVELTKVYRQALDSPILSRALEVKNGKCFDFSEVMCKKARSYYSPDKTSALHVMPIQEQSKEPEFLNNKFGRMFHDSVLAGRFDPDQDVVLIPHGKPHTFGSFQMCLHIMQAVTKKNDLEVHEVIAGFNKLYLCIGDRVAVGSVEGKITTIARNPKYYGKFARPASKTIDRWGRASNLHGLDESKIDLEPPKIGILKDADAVDAFLSQDRIEDKKNQASHIVVVQIEDSDIEMEFSTAGELNALVFTCCLTVHRSQGAEWRNVYLILHHLHAGMYSRELLYTAMTRARENCYLLARPAALSKCVERAMIRGNTLQDKARWYKTKIEERGRKLGGMQLGLLSSLDNEEA